MIALIITNINIINLQVQGVGYGSPDETYSDPEQGWKKQDNLRTI